jgi:hypothetical protein
MMVATICCTKLVDVAVSGIGLVMEDEGGFRTQAIMPSHSGGQ